MVRLPMCAEMDCFEKIPVTIRKNRLKEIRSQSDIVIKYVTSKEHPADIASRGSSVQKLSENQLWWHGPVWLNGTETEWPEITQESDEKSKRDYESELKKYKNLSQKLGYYNFLPIQWARQHM